MADRYVGTGYFTDNGDTGVQTALIDSDGYACFVKATTANIPSAKAGYQIGCYLMDLTTGSAFVNRGTAASCTFVDLS
jgi:hypothetical protein